MPTGEVSALLTALHALGAIVWVGGMFFAHMALRPSVAVLEPPQRLRLWNEVFPRFFRWVWIAVAALFASGLIIVQVDFNGFANVTHSVWTMIGLGSVMAVIYAYIYFVPFLDFRRAVAAEDWLRAADRQAVIRRLVATNLVLGLVTSALGASGRFLG